MIADYVVAALKNLFTDADIRASSDRYLRNAIIAVLAYDRASTLWDAARLLSVGEEGYAYRRARRRARARAARVQGDLATFFTAELTRPAGRRAQHDDGQARRAGQQARAAAQLAVDQARAAQRLAAGRLRPRDRRRRGARRQGRARRDGRRQHLRADAAARRHARRGARPPAGSRAGRASGWPSR